MLLSGGYVTILNPQPKLTIRKPLDMQVTDRAPSNRRSTKTATARSSIPPTRDSMAYSPGPRGPIPGSSHSFLQGSSRASTQDNRRLRLGNYKVALANAGNLPQYAIPPSSGGRYEDPDELFTPEELAEMRDDPYANIDGESWEDGRGRRQEVRTLFRTEPHDRVS